MKLAKQGGSILWSKMYTIDISQSLNRIGPGGGIRKLADGNFIVIGMMQQLNPLLGGSRTILAKIDPSGNILWQNTYGNSAMSSVTAFNVIDNPTDQTLIVSGMGMDKTTFNSSILVMKIASASGAITLQRQIGLSSENNTGFVIKSGTALYFSGTHSTGYTDSHLKVLYGKLSPTTFNPTWANTFGGAVAEYGASMKTSTGFMMEGTTFSFGNSPAKGNIFGMILDANGNYPGCYVTPIQLSTKNPGLTPTLFNLTASTPTLTSKSSPGAVAIALPVTSITLPTTNICQPIASPASEEITPAFLSGDNAMSDEDLEQGEAPQGDLE